MDRPPAPIRVSIVGGGFVGITTAVSFGERGHEIELVESDPARLASLREGRIPFFEPGVEEGWRALQQAGRVHVASALTRPADVVFLCVGTPQGPDGAPDLSQVAAAAAAVCDALSRWPEAPAVVVKSTVPPGTGRNVVLPALERAGALGVAFGLASNPEFLREGSALADARHPDRIVVGPFDGLSASRLRALYSGYSSPYVETTPETSETIKYVANAFLATKVAFANEIGNVCEPLGVHVDEVMRGVGLDPRIGPLFLRAGLGFGGSCFPKDVTAFAHLAREHGAPSRILEAVLEQNEAQPLRAVSLAQELIGPLPGKRVVILGLAFKAETSDVRETRALPLYRALVEAGAEVTCCDPIAGPSFAALVGEELRIVADPRAALRGQDLAIVQTEWPHFRAIPPADYLALMRRAAIVDGRRALDGAALAAAGAEYRAIGVGRGDKK